jgi:serine/threonine-protein kinase
MAPEQARGRAVDKRADIWAFGVVLFEMLTARRPFGGETASEILAAVIKDEPDWEAVPAGLPSAAVETLRRLLVKEPRRRIHDIADARILLEELDGKPEEPRVAAARAPRWREGLAWLVAVAGLGIAAGLAWKLVASRPEEPLTQFAVTLPPDQPIAFVDVPILALSLDGRKLAFTVSGPSGQTMIHLRAFDQAEARPIPGTEGGSSPFFSPDGNSLGFFADGRLKAVPLGAGGPALALADAPNSRGAVWAQDGSILFSPEYSGGLWRVSASGGAPQEVVSPDTEKGERTYRWPDLLPGDRAVLYTVGSLDSPNDYNAARVVVYSFDTGQRRVLVEGANMARFVPPGTLVYSRAGVLFAAAFNPDRLDVIGQSTPVLEGVAGDPSSGASYYAVAADGTLAAVRGAGSEVNRLLALVDRQGAATHLPLTARGFRYPRFSPDGTRLAFAVGSASGVGTDTDVWVHSQDAGSLSRLTFEGNAYPLWAPDGSRITYQRASDQALFTKSADGSGSEERLTPAGPDPLLPGSWSPDGLTLALTRIGSSTDVYLLTPGEEPRLFEKDASAPAFSPEGRWIAYTSPASGTTNVFVRPVDGEGKWQVSPDAGGYPRWSGDGRELFYVGIGTPQRPLMAVPVASGESFRAGPPHALIADLSRYMTATAPQVDWDAAPAGDRFVFVEVERSKDEGTRIDVALRWARHLAVAGSGSQDPGR